MIANVSGKKRNDSNLIIKDKCWINFLNLSISQQKLPMILNNKTTVGIPILVQLKLNTLVIFRENARVL